MKSQGTVSRREFCQLGASAVVAMGLGERRVVAAKAPGVGDKLGIAVIGCGGRGSGNPLVALQERLVAMVDVDEGRIADAMKKVEAKTDKGLAKVKVYHDYRRMYDECHKELDAVLIATPDHHHAPAAIRAIQLGKSVFCEKPLTWCLYEARKLTAEARRSKVATQMGNQGHSAEGYRLLCEYIWAGAIGTVVETHSLMSRNFGGQGGRPASQPVPAGLHWEEWLGPARARDYHPGLHPFRWRSWREFGTGTLGDMGCHVLDGVFWALRLSQAKKFTIECVSQTPGSAEMFPQNNHIRWQFPPRGDMPAVTVNSYDFAWPAAVKELFEKLGEKAPNGGTLYVGTKGYMVTGVYGENPRILPKEKHEATPKPPRQLPRSKHGMMGDFLAACRGGEAASSNFDYAGPFTEFILTGVVASHVGPGTSLEWDVERLEFVNAPAANRWVKRDYRKGWEV
ncbi:MAG: Gfo/Idh/MocA family oxidoreductase [Thermogemmata sp.]|uniref:Gfo/Idh/MocA family oxidoreductase n=1 Tax=Thermogemmata fonticola TaxID=2755323 RepID=A0A7V8VBZ4_9BACT|nr:Gfo/Idh/MocA family oxidoreductase [Thermogemmata fonticola]MBA2224937.1 Gfo/Idh/MocA family oxidoreductase [Thermogemmata fonticola]MCX8138092.1 Gfo/Idh/MocA family oxidoreductase [Gemmataceae bacterium]GIW84106.1 MAG: oxidoreductase [Gemmataceae bacterium]